MAELQQEIIRSFHEEVSSSKKKPDLMLLEAIDETLADLLGRHAREAVYDHLERNCYISRNEIPNRLDDFCTLLNANFGTGGKTIERAIARKLYSKLGKEFEEIDDFGLNDYVGKLSSNISSSNVPKISVTISTNYY